MNRNKMILMALAFLATVSSGVAGTVEHTGQWWREQAPSVKYHYAAGLFDDLAVGSNLLEFGMSAQVLVKPETQARDNAAPQKYVQFDGGQLVDGLDRFYADPRNANIPVSKASLVFVHSVAGMPRDTLQRMIEEYRRPGC